MLPKLGSLFLARETVKLRIRRATACLIIMSFQDLAVPPRPGAHGNRATLVEKYHRRAQRRFGLSVARRRLARPSHGATTDDVSDDAVSPLLFRRGDRGVDDGFTPNSPYLNVTFLNDNVVLASDAKGQIDAVRLPRYFHHDDDGKGAGGGVTCSNDGTKNRRGHKQRGKLLSSRIGNAVANKFPLPYVGLKSLRNGEAFVAGMPSGEIRIFATEHHSTWRTGRNGSLEKGHHCHNTLDRSEFFQCIFRMRGLRRRYRRELQCIQQGLRLMLRGQWDSSNAMEEISEWMFAPEREYTIEQKNKDNECLPSMPRRYQTDDALWDFLETGSTVFAAHVDKDKDCFSLRFIDERMVNAGGSDKAKKDSNSILCVDMESRENGRKLQEDITATCFVGENWIATAHVRRADNEISTNTKNRLCVSEFQNIIKLWDRRMLHKKKDKEAALASFPLENILGAKSSLEVCIVCKDTKCGEFHNPPTCSAVSIDSMRSGKDNIKHASNSRCTSCMAITRLASASQNAPSISVTLRTDETDNSWISEEVLIDSNFQDVLHHCRLGYTMKKERYAPFIPPPALTPRQDFMAAFGSNVTSSTDFNKLSEPPVLLFDLSRQNHPNSSIPIGKECAKSNMQKRSFDQFQTMEHCYSDTLIESIPVNLTDTLGLQSQLTCMSLDNLGTTLVCGSSDGDLFIWSGG